MTPEVSICIRAWRPETLGAAIESVLGQTFSDLEVVVADDRGTLEEIAASFGDPRVRYHRNPQRLGVTPNTRAALDLARGRYVGVLGDDDRLLPEFVETVVRRFDADPSVGVVFTSNRFDVDGALVERRCPLVAGRYEKFLATLLRLRPVPMSAALMRREIWETGELLPPLRDEAVADLQLWIGAALAGWAFEYVDAPLAIVGLLPDKVSGQVSYRDREVALWRSYALEDPECELLRREQLARSYVSRATARARAGDGSGAREDLAGARLADPRTERGRRLLLGVLAHSPTIGRAAGRAWQLLRRVRPYRSHWLGKAVSP